MGVEEIVRAEIAGWGRNDADEVMRHFGEDATFDIGPDYPSVVGHEAIREMMTAFSERGTCVALEIDHLAVDGHVVLTGSVWVRTCEWTRNFLGPSRSAQGQSPGLRGGAGLRQR
ncbi:nuclear transport factor 2 family protein [Mycobacterium sp. AMU20-3851]|uniref:YybH family protein n=1 Tax=Mycobacterium sp. AMU20-3851 TaxID=3122055 RepID=UPI0037541688